MTDMCGRFSLAIPDLQSLAEMLEAEIFSEYELEYRPRFNIAPQTIHWVLLVRDGKRILVPATWGWDVLKDKLLINARSETAAEKPTFREAVHKRRCLVPADGFYEWLREGTSRRPFWFHARDKNLLLMAGLYNSDESGKVNFLILTTDSNSVVEHIHSRMPVFIPRESSMNWLGTFQPALMKPADPALLEGVEVSTWVNSAQHEGPDCIKPAVSESQKTRQPTLF